jgi:LemA protein
MAGSGSAGRTELLESLDRAEAGLSSALGKLRLVVEAYPELKADRTVMQLSEELTSTENRIGFSRQAFNDAVNAHNDAIGQFPDSLVATACGFTAAGQLRSTTRAGERAPAMVHLS